MTSSRGRTRSDAGTDWRASPLVIDRQGAFFVGGTWDAQAGTMAGQMFVQYQIPSATEPRVPIVLIHGGGQTGACYLYTPDGRPSWFDFFVATGHPVYVVDLPGRGRSQGHDAPTPASRRPAADVRQRMNPAGESTRWPKQANQRQWPDEDRSDWRHFYASQVPSPSDSAAHELLSKQACCELLDEIGDAVLITHSQNGSVGWLVADARPSRVRGLIAIEPNGPPYHDVQHIGPPDWFEEGPIARPWGLTRTRLNYEPTAADASELKFVRQAQADGPGLARCWLQAEPARSLPSLQQVPILILTAEASYHATYDHGTSNYLRQAGVEHDYLRLEDVGIVGNGHMVMVERNNLEIAELIRCWISAKTAPPT